MKPATDREQRNHMVSAVDTYAGRTSYTENAAARYQHRKPSKNLAELSLVKSALSQVPLGSALDAPCGGGRISLLMARLGYQVTAADLSPAMVKIASAAMNKAGVAVPVHQRDLEALSYEPNSFDSVICFRLFHHFPTPEIRARVIAELCRVARRHVLLSYFSPLSLTSLKRGLQHRLLGKPRTKFHTPLSELRGYFEPHGFQFVKDFAQLRYVHTLHLALFEQKA